jgi:hypothetical protein
LGIWIWHGAIYGQHYSSVRHFYCHVCYRTCVLPAQSDICLSVYGVQTWTNQPYAYCNSVFCQFIDSNQFNGFYTFTDPSSDDGVVITSYCTSGRFGSNYLHNIRWDQSSNLDRRCTNLCHMGRTYSSRSL